jgi:hypothetical protein
MKEYKLVKFYPSLPKDWKEGMIVGLGDWYYDYSPCSGNYRHKFIHKSEIENNPEYWQEVIKTNYEILCFRSNGPSQRIANVIDNLVYGTCCEEGFIPNVELVLKWVALETWEVYQVKRLSDGELFTIGDNVRPSNVSPVDYRGFKKITRIDIDNEGCTICMGHTYFSRYVQDVTRDKLVLMTTNDNVNLSLEDSYWYIDIDYEISKKMICSTQDLNKGIARFSTKEKCDEYINSKKVLFTTEDGVDVYEGDIYWLITGDLSYCGQKASPIDKGRKFGHVYSTKEKAQEYIELNKPKYSYNQIYDFIKKQESTNNMWYTIFKNLEELKNDR